MTTKRPSRIKSAAFLRNRHPIDQREYQNPNFISDLPIYQSRFTINRPLEVNDIRRKSACSRLITTRTNPSITSQLWRQVHSTHSEYKLNNLERRGQSEEPVRINLLQKVDRIRRKNQERQMVFEKCLKMISKKTISHARMVKDQGERGDLNNKILQLLGPFERQRVQESQRYRARLLKIRQR